MADERGALAKKATSAAPCFRSRHEAALAASVKLPQKVQKLESATRDLTAHVAKQIKRGDVRLPRTTTAEEKKKFAGARQVK